MYKVNVVVELFSMHLERNRGESNKLVPAICIDCGAAGGNVDAGLVIYSLAHATLYNDTICILYPLCDV